MVPGTLLSSRSKIFRYNYHAKVGRNAARPQYSLNMKYVRTYRPNTGSTIRIHFQLNRPNSRELCDSGCRVRKCSDREITDTPPTPAKKKSTVNGSWKKIEENRRETRVRPRLRNRALNSGPASVAGTATGAHAPPGGPPEAFF